MANTTDCADALRELQEIIDKFDSGALPDENAAENLEVVLDHVRVLLDPSSLDLLARFARAKLWA